MECWGRGARADLLVGEILISTGIWARTRRAWRHGLGPGPSGFWGVVNGDSGAENRTMLELGLAEKDKDATKRAELLGLVPSVPAAAGEKSREGKASDGMMAGWLDGRGILQKLRADMVIITVGGS